MGSPSSNAARQYFIGIADKQIGPLSEEQVLLRIKTGSISAETLVWYEGMQEWSLISKVPTFELALKTRPQSEKPNKVEPQKVVEGERSKKTEPSAPIDYNQFLGDDKSVSIVFNEAESRLGDSSFASDRIAKVLIGIVLLILLVMGFFYVRGALNNELVAKGRSKTSARSADNRQLQLGKATSELLIDPKGAEQALLALTQSNSIDAVSTEASNTLIDFYSKNNRFAEAARLLLKMKKYGEAASLFSKNKGTYVDSERAYFLAYENSKVPEERKVFLKENIAGLLQTGRPIESVIERIKLFEKEFPGQQHPFGYYMKGLDERLSDIFSRISFHFVQGLVGYIDTEFPQMNLMDRPLVEIKRDRAGLYKIVGTYKGEVLLNKDRLQKIQFVFWLSGERWVLVDTNLTKERKKWAQQERSRLKNIGISGDQMLRTLEATFRNKFPNASLHERSVGQESAVGKKSTDF